MAPSLLRATAAALLAALVVVLPARSQPQLPPPAPEQPEVAPEPIEKPEPGVQVLDKGPVHEAFAQPGADVRGKGMTAPKAPPPPLPALPPPTKPDGDHGTGGPRDRHWDAERNDFIWISGFYRNAPPGREWQPGEWTKARNGTYTYAPGFWRPTNMNSWRIDLPEPPKSVENGPNTPAPSPDSVWIPGTWEFRNGEYVWRPGYWAQPQGEMVWQPPQYLTTGSGFSCIPGYWDCPLEDRGLLNAPVYFAQPLWQTPGWWYRPRFSIGFGYGGGWGYGGCFNSLFIGAGYNNFYYGNCWNPYWLGGGLFFGFGSRCWGGGWGAPWLGCARPFWGFNTFRPWCATAPGFCNPLWRNYCWLNRGNPAFAKNVQTAYAAKAFGVSNPPVPRVGVTSQPSVSNVLGNGVRAAAASATRPPAVPNVNASIVQPAARVAAANTDARAARLTNAAGAGAGATRTGIATLPAAKGASGGTVATKGGGNVTITPKGGGAVVPKGGGGAAVLPKGGGNVTVTPKGNVPTPKVNPVVQGNPVHAGAKLPKGNDGVITNPNSVRIQSGAGITNPQVPTGRLDRDLPRIIGNAGKIDPLPATLPKNVGKAGNGQPDIRIGPNIGGTIPNQAKLNPGVQPKLNPVQVKGGNTGAPPVIRSLPSTPTTPNLRPNLPSAPTIRPSTPTIRPSMPINPGGGVPRINGGGGGTVPRIGGASGGSVPRVTGGGGGARPIGGGGGARPGGGGGGKGGKR
jgi:hypothetical protein